MVILKSVVVTVHVVSNYDLSSSQGVYILSLLIQLYPHIQLESPRQSYFSSWPDQTKLIGIILNCVKGD